MYASAWQACLSKHLDVDFAHYVLDGLQHIFHIGIDPTAQLQSAKWNMHSAQKYPQII